MKGKMERRHQTAYHDADQSLNESEKSKQKNPIVLWLLYFYLNVSIIY